MRIVSLLPSATETLFAIGAGDMVAGVTHECDYPAAAASRPHLTSSALSAVRTSAEIHRHVRRNLHAGSSLYHLDAALLESLAPDLIVTQELCAVCAVSYEIVATAAKRLSGDPRIISLEPSSLEDVYANIITLGELTGRTAAARTLVDDLRARESAVRGAVEGLERPRTLILEWTDPPMNAGHWTPGLLDGAGGEPVLANPGANSRALQWDDIASADPDVLIVAPCGFDVERTRAEVRALETNPVWRNLRAIRERRVWLVDGNAYVNRPGPRLVDTMEIFAGILHPDASVRQVSGAAEHYQREDFTHDDTRPVDVARHASTEPLRGKRSEQ